MWRDEFEGTELDRSRWEVEVNDFGGGNGELQMYTDHADNVRVENSCLILEAHRRRTKICGRSRDYSSGRIRSKHRGDWTNGLFEVRAALPPMTKHGQGLWPAIWMLPTDDRFGRWPASGEIDLVEAKGSVPEHLFCSLHCRSSQGNHKCISTAIPQDTAKSSSQNSFQTFSVLREESAIHWFIDSQKVWQVERKHWTNGYDHANGPFGERFHFILNLAIAGPKTKFEKEVRPGTRFPAMMRVDWVRVYQ